MVRTNTDSLPSSDCAGRPRGRAAIVAALSAGLLLAGAADAYAVDSLAVDSSPDAQATVAMTISASGMTDEPSRLRVFVQQGSSGCAGDTGGASANADRQSRRSGSTEVITRDPSGSFSYAAQYTPPVSGTYAICAYFFRSTPTSSISSRVADTFSVAAAPPGATPAAPGTTPATSPPGATAPGTSSTTPGSPGSTTTGPKPTRCVVPKIKGLTYTEARRRIHRGGCIVGEVVKPNKRLSRPARPGGRTKILKVVSQRPKAGTVLKVRGRVNVQLKYYTPKAPKKR